MRLHALVDDLDVARAAVAGGATVIQLRLKGAKTDEVVERGAAFADLCAETGVTFVVNDDVDAPVELGADGVHLGRDDGGVDLAIRTQLLLGRSAATVEEAVEAVKRGASYIGAGPVWSTPSKVDADAPIGLEGLAAICDVVQIPVVAIGGIDSTNARLCMDAGATGVAVVRAARDTAALLAAL